jgi:septal ring factor EnvC (AmiA/AmiB activator)
MPLLAVAGSARAAGEGADAARAKARLAEVRGRIAALTNRLGDELQRRDALNARLREADLAITAKRREIEDLRGALRAAERHRGELRAAAARVQHELDAERGLLASQIRAAYLSGLGGRLRLLLSQSDPASAGRMDVYYGYLARQRALNIAAIDARAGQARDLLTQVDRSTAALQTLQTETAREVLGLQRARSDRAAALVAVSLQVDTGNRELAGLKREEQAEEALVADLARMLQDFPVDSGASCESLRGRLAWPVPGRIAAHYGDARAGGGSDLRRNGVLIEAARGAQVRAPCSGRVIYADWLQGLGLLLIIGHAGNFMTLYGHAEVLYKSVGDSVSPGEVIAGLADGGGAAPRLYFEIRRGRKTLDPMLWLRMRP